MNIEALACYLLGERTIPVTVLFTDEHAETTNGMPVALIRGWTVARDQAQLAQLISGELHPPGMQVYVEPETTHADLCSLWLAGFRVRAIGLSDLLAVPHGWHLAARRHHTAMTRGWNRSDSLRATHGSGV